MMVHTAAWSMCGWLCNLISKGDDAWVFTKLLGNFRIDFRDSCHSFPDDHELAFNGIR